MNKRKKTGGLSVVSVKKYNSPNYPSLDSVKQNPHILRKLPSRWQNNAKIITTLGLLGTISLSFSACMEKQGEQGMSENSYLNVAPVFEHGSGTGSLGCDMVVPPVFLSEEEARAVITEKAAEYGLMLDGVPPSYISENNLYNNGKKYSWEKTEQLIGKEPVGVDLYNEEKKIAFVYVNTMEAEVFDKNGEWYSSVSSFMPKDRAILVVEDFKSHHGNDNVGVFYDPNMDNSDYENYQKINEEIWQEYSKYYNESIGEWDSEEKLQEYSSKMEENRNNYDENAKVTSKANLIAQVSDFFEWLQGQGII